MFTLEPTQQCRSKVEADAFVVVNQRGLGGVPIRDRHGRVGSVTFSVNTLVPVMKRRRARLLFHDSRPGIFARGLVKVSVNDERGHKNIGRRV